jgi:hypothetical protein
MSSDARNPERRLGDERTWQLPPGTQPGVLVCPPNGAMAKADASAPRTVVKVVLAPSRIAPAGNGPPNSPKSITLGATLRVMTVSLSCAFARGANRVSTVTTETNARAFDTDPPRVLRLV